MRRLKFRPRQGHGISHQLTAMVGSVAAVLLVGYLFLELVGVNGVTAYRVLFGESLLTRYGLSESVVKATPLILAGLAVAVAFRMRLWNIGAEGQLYVGAVAATFVALFLPPWGVPRLPLMLAAACGAGAAWAFVPGILKASLGVSEILVTLMGNYVAILITDHLCYGPWKGSTTFGFPMSDRFPADACLPTYAGTRVHAGLFIGILTTVLLWAVLWRTRWGFQVRVAGSAPRAAEYAGYRTTRDAMVVMIISGALAGLAGGVEMAGVLHRLQPRFSPGYGYTAILVAWLARLHPLAVPPVALFFGALLTGGEQLQVSMGVPSSVVDIMQGLILLSALAGDVLVRYRLVWHHPRPEGSAFAVEGGVTDG